MHESILFQLIIILLAGKIGAEVCERWLRLPAVLGEILAGAAIAVFGAGWFHAENETLQFLAQLGVILLLLEIGLNTNLDNLLSVGGGAFYVACMGVALTLSLGFGVLRLLGVSPEGSLFVAGALSATSIGISARVYSDCDLLQSREAQICLGAAVADDILGLIVITVLSGMAVGNTLTASSIIKPAILAVLFLFGAVFLGLKLTPWILDKIKTMQSNAALATAAILFCLILSEAAERAHLAAIIGAFAAGLVLAKAEQRVHFEMHIHTLGDIFIPIFFVVMGAGMNPSVFNPMHPSGRGVILLGAVIFAVVTLTKFFAGFSVPLKNVKRTIIGSGMLPRGEVSLIAAGIGISNGVLNQQLYAAILFVVIGTTILTPLMIKMLANREKRPAPVPPKSPSV
jgi:Kef-type K+ transport system membrane component KefB